MLSNMGGSISCRNAVRDRIEDRFTAVISLNELFVASVVVKTRGLVRNARRPRWWRRYFIVLYMLHYYTNECINCTKLCTTSRIRLRKTYSGSVWFIRPLMCLSARYLLELRFIACGIKHHSTTGTWYDTSISNERNAVLKLLELSDYI